MNSLQCMNVYTKLHPQMAARALYNLLTSLFICLIFIWKKRRKRERDTENHSIGGIYTYITANVVPGDTLHLNPSLCYLQYSESILHQLSSSIFKVGKMTKASFNCPFSVSLDYHHRLNSTWFSSHTQHSHFTPPLLGNAAQSAIAECGLRYISLFKVNYK